MSKAVILVGGPQKGTRFRPLSFDLPKPLFPVAGRPMIEHLIRACCRVVNMREVFLIGFYQQDETLSQFISSMSREFGISIRYLQEYTALGTAGGFYHFRDQIRRGNPEAFFLINGDVCGDFALNEMLEVHRSTADQSQNHGQPQRLMTVMATEATRQQSLNYGCIVENKDTKEMSHFVEKPSTFVSTTINCGIYLCSLDLFQYIANVYKNKHSEYLLEAGDETRNGIGSTAFNSLQGGLDDKPDCIHLEQDVLTPLAGTGQVFVYNTTKWWSQIKTAGSAIYANRHYLELFRREQSHLLATNSPTGPGVIGDVYIDQSAVVNPTAVLGPNVSIGKGVKIGAGVRIKESIILREATINDHTLIMHSIVGWNNVIGSWTRIEGTPCDPNPNKAFAKTENQALFNGEGKLNPLITVLGSNVQVPSEVIVLNSIVLPHKELSRSYKNEIIL